MRFVKAEVISIIGQIQGLSAMSTVDYKGDLSSGQIWKVRRTVWHVWGRGKEDKQPLLVRSKD